MSRFLCLFLALLPFAALAAPPEPPPVTGSLRLSHVSRDLWRAEYRFDRPVTAVDFGPAVVELLGPLRKLTPIGWIGGR